MPEPLEALAEELATFSAALPGWQGQEGKFALISGKDVLGVYDTYSDALTVGYEKLGLKPFLVKQISAIGVTANFTRDLRPAWRISASL